MILADQLYDSRPSSHCNSQMRHYYTQSQDWFNDPQKSPTFADQLRNSMHQLNLQQDLYDTKTNFYSSQGFRSARNFGSTQSVFSFQNIQQRPKKVRNPHFVVEISEEEKQRRQQLAHRKKVEYQNQLRLMYEKEQQRQKIFKQKQEEKKQKQQQQHSQFLQMLTQNRKKEFQILRQKQIEQEKQYRKQLEERKLQQEMEQFQLSQKEIQGDIEQFDINDQKQQLFQDEKLKQSIKNMEIPDTIQSLVNIIKKNCLTQLTKIYKAFLFMHYHITLNESEQKSGKQTTNVNPETTYSNKQGTILAIATLFNEILSQLKFNNCQIVQGIGKQQDDKLIDLHYKGNEINHTWNKIFFKGKFYLIDVHYGSGYVSNDRYFKKLENFYFFTDPYQFIYSHYPTQHKEQSLLQIKRMWSIQKFNEMPNFTPYFFYNQLHLYNNNTKQILKISQNEIIFKFKSKSRQLNHTFQAIIEQKGKPITDIQQNCEIIDFEQQISELNIQLPNITGIYQIQIQAQQIEVSQHENTQNNIDNNQLDEIIQNNQVQQQNQLQVQEENENEQQEQQYSIKQIGQWVDIVKYEIHFTQTK